MTSTRIEGFPFNQFEVVTLASRYAKKMEDDGILLGAELDEGKITEKMYIEAYFQLMLGIVGLNSLMVFANRNFKQFAELISDFPKHSPEKLSFTWLKISGMMKQEHIDIIKEVHKNLSNSVNQEGKIIKSGKIIRP